MYVTAPVVNYFMPTQEQLQEWNKTFTRIERVEDYQKLKVHLASVCGRITELTDGIENFKQPHNPREDATQYHDKVTHRMLLKQKERLEERLNEMAKQIEADLVEARTENL